MSNKEMRKTREYRYVADRWFVTFEEAEKDLGRPLKEAEKLAIWDNKQDQILGTRQ